MTSEKYFESSNHDGEYFSNEDTENIFKGSHLRKLIFLFQQKIMVPVTPCIFEQAIQRDFVHPENLVSGEDIYSGHHPHKMP